MLALLAMALLAGAAGATSLKPLNLQEIARHSQRIFRGECLSASQGVDSRGLPYTAYAFRVSETLKGRIERETVTVKQFGRPAQGQTPAGAAHLRIAGMPHYRPGHSYLLFLPDDSRWGFAAPVGLMQGAFRISGRGGERIAVNGVGNLNLALDTSAPLDERFRERDALEVVEGPVRYADLRATIMRIVQGERFTAGQVARALKGGTR